MCTGRKSASCWIPALIFLQSHPLTSLPWTLLLKVSWHIHNWYFPTATPSTWIHPSFQPYESLPEAAVFSFMDFTLNVFFYFYSDRTQHKKKPYNWRLIRYHIDRSLYSQPVGAQRQAVQDLLQWHTQINSKPSLSQVRNHFFIAWPFFSACSSQENKINTATEDQAPRKQAHVYGAARGQAPICSFLHHLLNSRWKWRPVRMTEEGKASCAKARASQQSPPQDGNPADYGYGQPSII